MHITKMELFEHKDEEFFGLGLKDGSLIIKKTGTVLVPEIYDHVQPVKNESNEMQDDKVTFIGYQYPMKVVFGSQQGRVSFYEMNKKSKVFSYVLDQQIMKQVLNVIELPKQITDIKKHLYYVLTYGNLFALTKSDH